jgi:hypothetical protein
MVFSMSIKNMSLMLEKRSQLLNWRHTQTSTTESRQVEIQIHHTHGINAREMMNSTLILCQVMPMFKLLDKQIMSLQLKNACHDVILRIYAIVSFSVIISDNHHVPCSL